MGSNARIFSQRNQIRTGTDKFSGLVKDSGIYHLTKSEQAELKMKNLKKGFTQARLSKLSKIRRY